MKNYYETTLSEVCLKYKHFSPGLHSDQNNLFNAIM